ncbi:MAG: cytochrome c oxidase, subunit [Roseomonas sp.]|nr:cytochrome c oxidase, subunit [Roseomonas sp.]
MKQENPAYGAWLLPWALAACDGPQSALDPAGHEAGLVAHLFWVMLVASGVIWLLVMGIAFYAARGRHTPWQPRRAGRFILVCGAIVPTLALAALLVFGLRLMPGLRAAGEGLRVAVQGEQFWWRVRYELPDGRAFATANEIRLPVGSRTEFLLTAQDVIHSFWVPNLGGKMDLIPGTTNRLVLEPTRTGTFRGVCAEFCGASHARMAFSVTVMEPSEFEAWAAAQIRPAAVGPVTGPGEGAALFLARGCAACHTVRGTGAAGRIGPDLTHLGGRETLAAGILPNTVANIDRFIRETREIKPGARMPSFGMLPEHESAAIAAWLGSLR